MSQRRFMIAAPSSGSGKTLITCGLMRLLREKGREIYSFKCGPDFIDPMFHRHITGHPAGNLDAFMTDPPVLRSMLARGAHHADVTVLEGVMGYFDGIGFGNTQASSSDIAVQTGTPVVLIVSGRGISTSILPQIEGMLRYPGGEMIRGILLNRVTKGIFPAMKKMIEDALPVKVIGYLPEMPQICLESRHLGLMMPDEIEDLDHALDILSTQLAETVNVAALDAISRTCEQLPSGPAADLSREEYAGEGAGLRIGVARDEAFCFFYAENLRMLEASGAELVYFSPVRDGELPRDISALLLVGGYPELFARTLSENISMRKAIKEAYDSGMPVLAECGGFLYLHETLASPDGKDYPMCGVIPARAYNNHRLTRFGYITLQNGTFFGEDIGSVRAHEFHHYESTAPGEAFLAVKPSGKRQWSCIYSTNSLYAGFPHLYFPANPQIVTQYLRAARRFSKEHHPED